MSRDERSDSNTSIWPTAQSPQPRATRGIEVGSRRRGSHALEYAMLIAIVVAAMAAMQTYVRRAVQAHLKLVEMRLNASQAQ